MNELVAPPFVGRDRWQETVVTWLHQLVAHPVGIWQLTKMTSGDFFAPQDG